MGIYIKICSILLHYPLKLKSRSFRPCLNPLVKEQASSRYELVGQRERGTSTYFWSVLIWDTVLHCFNPCKDFIKFLHQTNWAFLSPDLAVRVKRKITPRHGWQNKVLPSVWPRTWSLSWQKMPFTSSLEGKLAKITLKSADSRDVWIHVARAALDSALYKYTRLHLAGDDEMRAC